MPEEEEEEPPRPRVRVKRELVEPPAEPSKRRTGFARSPEDHYCFQVGLINQVVKSPWVRCFGGLGTGFVGVRPDTPASGSASSRKPSGRARSAAATAAAEGDEGGAESAVVPPDATIVIFVNAPAAPLQTRGGRTIDGYKDALDRSQRTLEWSAQRCDKNNKRIEAILAHSRSGGRVVVGVRSPAKRHFQLLGEVSHIDLLARAAFVVEPGDHVIQERGTRTFHKVVTAACLNQGLRSGVGLTPARYPVKGTARWCAACCYVPPKAMLHFRELHDDGVAAFQTPVGGPFKRERKVKLEAEVVEPSLAPAKRLRCKTSPDSVVVKTERLEEEASSASTKFEVPAEEPEVPLKADARPELGPGLLAVKCELQQDPPESMSPETFTDDPFGP